MSGLVRTLYPLRVRKNDLRTVLRGLARYIQGFGYWPTTHDLSGFLKADHGAVVDLLKLLIEKGISERNPSRAGRAKVGLTRRGWQLLGKAPLEPWSRRPGSYETQVAYQAARKLQMVLKAEEANG